MVQAFAERIRSLEGFGSPPIIDVEMHFGRKMDLSALTVANNRSWHHFTITASKKDCPKQAVRKNIFICHT